MSVGFHTIEVLKADDLGSIEYGTFGGREAVRRRAAGGLLGPIARLLLAREARALTRLGTEEPLPGVAGLLSQDGGRSLLRSWVPGVPLHRAEVLPENFFELLAELVGGLHARGVAHNDLHKEPNILVQPDGRPGLVDFQLASVHRVGSGRLARRAAEDLRHVEKHALRYAQRDSARRSRAAERGLVARTWMATGKPLYNLVTRRLIRRPDHEGRRPRGGPWPEWGPRI